MDKVYSIWLMTGIKEHKVLRSNAGWRKNGLIIKHGFDIFAVPQDNGTWKGNTRFEVYYPTREAARTAALAQCHERIRRARKEIASNERAIKKLEGMKRE